MKKKEFNSQSSQLLRITLRFLDFLPGPFPDVARTIGRIGEREAR